MITKPHFPKFRMGEVLQFLHDILSICFSYDPDKLELGIKVADLKKQVDLFDTVYKMERGSEISRELAEIDQHRDACIVGIRKCADTFSYHFKEPIRKAAILVMKSIDKYGKNIAKQNYSTETLSLDKIVADSNSNSSLHEAFVTLNISDWVDEMKRLNDLFSKRSLERDVESASKPGIVATDQRKIAIHSYYELIKAIDAHDVLNTEGTYKGLVNEHNVLTDQYNHLVDKRSNNSEGEDEEESTAD